MNGTRLLTRLTELGAIGAGQGNGRTRLAFSREDHAARKKLLEWMLAADLCVKTDELGSLYGFTADPGVGDAPVVLAGSHIDTVRNAGHLDGCLGVIAALEAVSALKADSKPAHAIFGVAAFANEEGVVLSPDLMGSRYFCGNFSSEDFRRAAAAAGFDPSGLLHDYPDREVMRLADLNLRAFLELHIEQGPVLETREARIGIVTGVQGCRWLSVTLEGTSNHAGTTPMSLRKDAFAGVCEVGHGLERMALAGKPNVATVGTCAVHRGSINVVPGSVAFTIDLRDGCERQLDAAESTARTLIANIAQRRGLTYTVERISASSCVAFDAQMVELLRQSCNAQLHADEALMMISGASHDAQILAAHAPTAMLFIPSLGGISHNPAEASRDEDVITGARVLWEAMRRAAYIGDSGKS